MNITIYGVDPAAAKGLCVCKCVLTDSKPGTSSLLRYPDKERETDLEAFANEIKNQSGPVLIVWDAPLTHPQYYGRPIEKAWKSWVNTRSNQLGLSVREAAGCSHWAITQKMLGFPSLDGRPLPGSLFSDSSDRVRLVKCEADVADVKRSKGNEIWLLESHPSLAIALKSPGYEPWYRGYQKKDGMTNKSSDDCAISYSEQIKGIWGLSMPEMQDWKPKKGSPGKDDQIDAFVSMVLGIEWLMDGEDKKAKISGDCLQGSFLLPYDPSSDDGAWEKAEAKLKQLEVKKLFSNHGFHEQH